jgi:hypothetical protein
VKAIYYEYPSATGDSYTGIVAVFTTEEKAKDFLVLVERHEEDEANRPSKCPFGHKYSRMTYHIDDYDGPIVDPTELSEVLAD